MIKYFVPLLSLLSISCFGHGFGPEQGSKKENLDYKSGYAKKELKRAEIILKTLVPNANQYQLVLSDNPNFGGMALPPKAIVEKPAIIVYKGALANSVPDEDLAFMLGHELGHIALHHMEKYDAFMDNLMKGPPIGISATTFSVYRMKAEENEADQFGYKLYKKAGYNMNFFNNTYNYILAHEGHPPHTSLNYKVSPTLSVKDTHFSMADRFSILADQAQNI